MRRMRALWSLGRHLGCEEESVPAVLQVSMLMVEEAVVVVLVGGDAAVWKFEFR